MSFQTGSGYPLGVCIQSAHAALLPEAQGRRCRDIVGRVPQAGGSFALLAWFPQQPAKDLANGGFARSEDTGEGTCAFCATLQSCEEMWKQIRPTDSDARSRCCFSAKPPGAY